MAIDETDRPDGTVGAPGDDDSMPDANPRYSADDFRLRLDSPLFHRDPGMEATQAPMLRELTWEHVVHPADGQGHAASETSAAEHPSDALSIEALLEQARAAAEPRPTLAPVAEPVAEPVLPVEPLPPVEPLLPMVPRLPTVPRLPMAPRLQTDATDGSGDTIDLTAWLESAAKSTPAPTGPAPGEFPVLSLATSTAQTDDASQIGSLLAALEQLDEVEAARSTSADEPSIAEPATDESSTAEPATAEPAVPAFAESAEPAILHRVAVEPVAVSEEAPVAEPPGAELPLAEAPGAEPPGAEPPLAEAPVETTAGVRTATEGSAAHPVAERPARASAVEAELNRLAFLPDQEEEPGPVAIPAIAYSDQRVAPEMPALSQHEMFTPKASASPPASRMQLVDVSASFTPAKRRQKKGLFGRLVMILLVVGLVGGGGFAAKYYLLDTHWASEVKALAGDVEEARGLEFHHAIDVTTLPPREYATKLATTALGVTGSGRDALAGEWRAMGLLQGELNLDAIGLAAMPDAPAYYDPATETIFVADDMPGDLYRFAMHRALTLALLDQQYGWGSAVKDASDAVAHGMRAYYDADALTTATSLLTATERTQVFTEIFGLYAAYTIPASPAPFASTVAGRLGVALEPYFQSIPVAARTGVAKDTLISDGQALDLRRLLAGAGAATSTDARGMLYWYHVLAARVDDDTAWQAALAWQNDLVTWGSGAGGRCVDARLQVDPAALDRVSAALDQWAAAAPAASGTAVTRTTDGSAMQLQIVSCDAGPGVPTNDSHGYLALGGAPLRAEQYRLLRASQPTLPAAQVACAVYGDDPVTPADERGVIDPAEGWSAPANHPTPDPNRLGCAPAA